MAITFTNARKLSTAISTVPWDNQSQASMAFFYRYEPTGGTSASVLNTNYFISRGLAPFYLFTQAGSSTAINVRFNVNTPAAGVARTLSFNVGTTYHVALTFDQGHQVVWINGIPTQFGTLTGNTKTGNWAIDFGGSSVAGTPFIWTLHDFAMWNGYVLTATDVAGLRDGTSLPPDIGGSATWRGRWTMSGTSGATVTLGDAGVANAYGDHTYDLKNFAGTGTAVYANPLIFEPAVNATPYMATSGRCVGFRFYAISGGAVVTPTQALISPTISINGGSPVTLVNPWITGYHTTALYSLPTGQSVSPSDTVTITAPAAWANTGVGVTSSMTNLAVNNLTGKSSFGTDDLVKTFKPGWNNAHPPYNGSVYSIPKNWRLRCDFWSAGTVKDGTGKPTSNTSFAMSYAYFVSYPSVTQVDNTVTLPVGLWAVCWDDLDPTHPTTCGIGTVSTGNISIAERFDLRNLGVGGVGIVRVFEVTPISAVVATGSNVNLRLEITSTSKVYNYDNLVIHGPGDFTPGTPTVLDRSDPYAISSVYESRLANGVGSLRFVDSATGYGGYDQMAQPDEVHSLTDFSWGLTSPPLNKGVVWTQARPWDQEATPYLYGTLFGSPFPATLSAPITSTGQTTLTISDAATAPVLIGLMLQADSELMRVTSVSGTSVTVERAVCNTTAATHAAGTIQVKNRWDSRGGQINSGQYFEIVSTTPHGFSTGQTVPFAGTWPNFRFADGTYAFGNSTPTSIVFYHLLAMTTGANTAVIFVGTAGAQTTLDGVYPLTSAAVVQSVWPSANLPFEFIAKTVAKFDGCALHLNIPNAASDALCYRIWGWILANLPADRKIYFEFSNEPWNPFFYQYGPLNRFSVWLYPTTAYGWEFYVLRMTQILTMGRSLWTAAGRDPSNIIGLINRQKSDTTSAARMLEFAKGLGVPIGCVAIATYTHMDTGPATHSAYWMYDDEQANDLQCHDLVTNSTGYSSVFAAMNSVIKSYNDKYGENVRLYGYEGGVNVAAPIFSTTLSVAIDESVTSFVVAAASGLVAGTPILCETEWMTITGVSGNTLTVTRGAYGSTAAPHALSKSVRTAYVERSHDLMLNPTSKYVEWEFYAMEQEAGFVAANTYALAMGSGEFGTYYGAYHYQAQKPGIGDGTDGKFDNRLVLCCPGKTHTKSASTSQELNTVSARGQAYLDWMAATSSGGGTTYIISPAGGVNRGGHSTNLCSMHFAAAGGERLGGKGRLAQVIVIAAGGEHLGGHAGISAAAIHIVPAGGVHFGGSADLPSIVYNIYANDGSGGPVSYIEPVATVADTTWTTAPLAVPGDYIWHVRAADLITGLEEHNADARVEVILDADGNDITGRPAPPIGLGVSPLKGGKVRVFWSYRTPSGRSKPSEYRVYGGTPTISYATPLATIAYTTDGKLYTDLPGLTSGASYQFGVRAANATAEEKNTTVVTATPLATGPRPPEGLTGSAI